MMARLTILPLHRDEAMRVLGRIVAFTVFIVGLLIFTTLVASFFVEGVRFELEGHVTLQVMTSSPLQDISQAAQDKLRKLVLNAEGVKAVTLLGLADIEHMMAPWLHQETAFLRELPLPLILDVQVERSSFDAAALQSLLSEAGYESVVDDHLLWFADHYFILSELQSLTFILWTVIVTAMLLAVMQTIRGSLALNEDAVNVLRIIGAKDKSIAFTFARHALRVSLVNSLLGFLWAVAVISFIAFLDKSAQLVLLPSSLYYLFAWMMLLVMAFVSFAVFAASMATTRRVMARQP